MATGLGWRFSRLAGSNWVLVTMQDGSTVAGLFGGQSFASSDPAERDIYIEQVYDYTADGEWHCARPGNSILVMREEIRFVEFFRPSALGRPRCRKRRQATQTIGKETGRNR